MSSYENSNETNSKFSRVIFWLLWGVLLLIVPVYGFTLLVEVSAVNSGNILSYISPIIGLLVLIAQITVFVLSYKQMKQGLPLSKPYLTFIGGSIVIGFVWAGGCAMMGPWRLAG